MNTSNISNYGSPATPSQVADRGRQVPEQRTGSTSAADTVNALQKSNVELDAKPRLTEGAALSQEQIKELAERIESSIQIENRALSFRVNDDINRTVVSVIDRDTDEILRQIPSEEFVEIAAAIRRLGEEAKQSQANAGADVTGLLLNEKA